MNARERFLEVCDFNPNVRTLKWEFGYWGETLKKWYAHGLPQHAYPVLPTEITTPASSLYVPAWTSRGDGVLPNGIAVFGGAAYWPTQGFPIDQDVRRHFGMDPTQRLIDVNLLFDPLFEIEILEETNRALRYCDIDGVKRVFLKEEATIPTGFEWPVTGWESWNRLKAERINLKDLSGRFPKNWPQLVAEYRNRDYPLAIGGYPTGFFGVLAHLLGYENLFIWYYEQPDLIHDILATFTELWIAVFAEVLDQVEVDDWQIWEDMSDKNGSMISLGMVREFMLPHMRRIADFVKAPRRAADSSRYRRRLQPAHPAVRRSRRHGHVALRTHGTDRSAQDPPRVSAIGYVGRDSEVGDQRRPPGDRRGARADGRNAPPRRLHPAHRPLRPAGCFAGGFHVLPPPVE